MFTQNTQVLTEKKTKEEEEREGEVEALVTAKATVLLPLMRKNSENNNTHTHTLYIDKRYRKDLERTNKQNLSLSSLSTVYSCQEISILLNLLHKYQFFRYIFTKKNKN